LQNKNLNHHIMRGSGPLIHCKEVTSSDFRKKGEESHRELMSHENRDMLGGEASRFGWRSYGGSIREDLRVVSPF
jgi:hypothetical protein